MKCTCGEDINENDKFCKNCGLDLKAQYEQKVETEVGGESNLDSSKDVNNKEHEVQKEGQEEVQETTDIKENIKEEAVENIEEFKDSDQDNDFEYYENEFDEVDRVEGNNKKSKKGIIIALILIVLLGVVSAVAYVLTRSSIFIESAVLDEYPIATVKLASSDGKPIDRSVGYEFYQDGELVESAVYIGNDEFNLFLNYELLSGDNTKIEVRIVGENKTLDSDTYEIKYSAIENLFTNNSVYNEQYPELEIKTNFDYNAFNKYKINSFRLEVEGVEYPATIESNNKSNIGIVSTNIDGAKRKLDFEYTYVYEIGDKTYRTDAKIELEPLDNIIIDKRKSDYSEYPIVRHYFNIYDAYGNMINDKIDIEGLAYFEMTNTGLSPIEYLSSGKLVDGGKSSIEMVVDTSGSLEEYGLRQTKNSLNAFLNVVDFTSNDEVEIIVFNTEVYERQRFTNNKDKLTNAINRLEIDGLTALYDALMHGLDRTVIQRGSKIIIATTDGMDNNSYYDYQDVIDKALEFEIPIYIIGVGEYLTTSELKEITSATGGEFIQIDNFNYLEDKFKKIYHSEKDGIVFEYDVTALENSEKDIVLKIEDNYYGGEETFEYNPIFVSWGGNVRVDDPSTPYDEREFDSNYYDDTHTYEVVFEDVSWQEANQRAMDKGGYLARITSEEEFDVITEAIEVATTSKSYLYWLGGSRKNSYDGRYTWVDENLNVKSETLPDVLWLPGEPTYYAYDNNGNVMFEEEYLNMFYVKSLDKWVLNDVTDDVLNQYSIYEGKIAYVIEYEK